MEVFEKYREKTDPNGGFPNAQVYIRIEDVSLTVITRENCPCQHAALR